jgi:hypothetical protein
MHGWMMGINGGWVGWDIDGMNGRDVIGGGGGGDDGFARGCCSIDRYLSF